MKDCGGISDDQIQQKMNFGGAGNLKRDEYAPYVQRILEEQENKEPAQFFMHCQIFTAIYD